MIHESRTPLIGPLAEDPLQIPGGTFEHNRADGNKGAVFDGGGENGVVLRKVEGIAEGGELRLRSGADDNVQLKEGVENVYAIGGKIGLAEGVDFEDLVNMCVSNVFGSKNTVG